MGKKGKKKSDFIPKVLIRFEDLTFNIYELKRVKKIEVYDPEEEEGQKYGIKLMFVSPPYEAEYFFQSRQARNRKIELLDMTLQDNHIDIINLNDFPY